MEAIERTEKVLIFERWDIGEVQVQDVSLENYINLKGGIPHTFGKHSRQQFNKSELSIVERLINKMMRKGKNTGKKIKTFNIVREAFEIIHKRTKKNPFQVLIEAIENAAPREEIVRLRYGGISVPKAVDTAPQRRVDLALMNIVEGARRSAFKSKRSIAAALAQELIKGSSNDAKTFSITRKDDKERVAKSAR